VKEITRLHAISWPPRPTGPKWTLLEAVNFLVRGRDLVVRKSSTTTRQWRQFEQYEKRHSVNFFIQRAENFIGNEVAGEELWEKVGAIAMRPAYSSETKVMSLDPTHFIDLVELAVLQDGQVVGRHLNWQVGQSLRGDS
jgi:hypothetical protein